MDQRAIDRIGLVNNETVLQNDRKVIPVDGVPGLELRVGATTKAYYLRYRDTQGKQKRVKIGDATVMPLATARTLAREVLLTSATASEEEDAIQETKLDEFLDAHYLPWIKSQCRTGENIVRFLRKWLTPYMDRYLSQISTLDLERIRRSMKSSGLTPSSSNRFLSHFAAALRRAEEWKMLKSLPKMPKPDKIDNMRIRSLSPEERARLFSALKDRDEEMREARRRHIAWQEDRDYENTPEYGAYVDYLEPAVIIALNTGARRSEVLGMEWKEIDFERKTWTIPAARAKSAKSRTLPLNHEAYTVIQNMRNWTGKKKSVWVFPDRVGKSHVKDLKKSFGMLLERANIKDFCWHSMRHCFISDIVENGTDLETCRSLSGHADLKTLQRYAHSTDQRRRAAVIALEQIQRPENIVDIKKAGN